MRLVRNSCENSHALALASTLEGADEAMFSVAFLKQAGADAIKPLLMDCLQRGGIVRGYVGTDFFLTEPDALELLLDLERPQERCRIFIAGRTAATFHPKVYVGIVNTMARCLIGSANLTGGALNINDELSALLECEATHPFVADLRYTFNEFERSGRCSPLDHLQVMQYRSLHSRAEKARRRVEKALKEVDGVAIDLAKLGLFYAKYRRSDEFNQLAERKRKHRIALPIQHRIASLPSDGRLSRQTIQSFQAMLKDLMTSNGGRHLWHSGAIFRKGSQALEFPKEMTQLFALGREMSKRAPVDGFARMQAHALGVPGVGINMITEILATFAPRSYAIFNGNTAGALDAMGISTTRSRSKRSFRPESYEQARLAVDGVRERIGAADFLEADSFLNFVYFSLK